MTRDDTPAVRTENAPPARKTLSPAPPQPMKATGDAETARNRNVRLYFWFTFLSQAGQTLWAFITLTVYLEQLDGVASVGVATSIQGAVQSAAAPIAGWAADKFSRQGIIRVGAMVGFTAVVILSVGLHLGRDVNPGGKSEFHWLDDHVRYIIITVGLASWGAYQGVWLTSLETIFADSIPTGQRSHYNMYKFMIQQAANTLGPLFALILYLCVGGTSADWAMSTVVWVFFGGVLACIPAMILLFFFSDKHMRGSAAAAHTEVKKGAPAPGAPTGAVQAPGNENDEAQPTGCAGRFGLTTKSIPGIVIASNMINGLGSGMTIRFFPLFFAKEIGLNPMWSHFIYVVLPPFMAFAGKAGQRVSRKIGRVQTSFIYIAVGSTALALLWAIGEFWPNSDGGQPDGSGADGNNHWPVHRFWYLMFPIYLISTIPNCTFPLTQSILMDYVPKHQRGRWNSLQSFTRFGWSGSAAIGGFIIKGQGYGLAFLITAIMQMISAFLLLIIIPLMVTEDGTDERAVAPAKAADEETPSPLAKETDGLIDDKYSVAHSATHSVVASIVGSIGRNLSPGSGLPHSAPSALDCPIVEYLPADGDDYDDDGS